MDDFSPLWPDFKGKGTKEGIIELLIFKKN